MTVRNEIDVELWEVIQKNYESENYDRGNTGCYFQAHRYY